MFAGRKVKKLESMLDDAALEMTIAEKIGPPPDNHAGAQQSVIRAAKAAIAVGESAAVSRILGNAASRPMFRGENHEAWDDFVAAVRKAVQM